MTRLESLVCNSIDCASISKERLFELFQSVTSELELIAQFIQYLTCEIDKEVLPETIEHKNYPNAKLESFDMFKDEVTFSYDHCYTYYFASKEDADAYAKDGSCGNKGWQNAQSDTHPYKGAYICRWTTTMDKQTWLAHSRK